MNRRESVIYSSRRRMYYFIYYIFHNITQVVLNFFWLHDVRIDDFIFKSMAASQQRKQTSKRGIICIIKILKYF
jgi:uncharacterized protein YeeX (DUF496 family)